jgi:TonB family protein
MMEFPVTYLLQSSMSIILLYAVYALFLERETFFAVNRIYLAGSMAISLIMPFFSRSIPLSSDSEFYRNVLDTIVITPGMKAGAESLPLTTMQGALIVYLTGVALFLLRFVFQLFQVTGLIRKFGVARHEGLRIVFTASNYQPFSFFRLVFIPVSLQGKASLSQVIAHEKVHIRQAHTLDLLLLELLTVVQWFNPVVWLYRRSVKSVHEYLADEGVLHHGFSRKDYAELLLDQTLGIQVNDLTHNFNYSLLKNRMIMMTKTRSKRWRSLKAVFAIPVITLLVVAFSTPATSVLAQEEPKKAQNSESAIKVREPEETVYEVVKTMPEFKGGYDALVQFMVSNIKYPEEAKKKGTTGTVFVSFIVNKFGKITNPKILKSADPLLDAEAIRVVKAMPDWHPGKDDNGEAVNVAFTLPINFSINEKEKPGKK